VGSGRGAACAHCALASRAPATVDARQFKTRASQPRWPWSSS